MVVKIKSRRKMRRGHRTYHGSHKKWRGGGSRGGRGQAGYHKHKWSYTVKYAPEKFGKKGFKIPEEAKQEINSINLKILDEQAERLLKEKLAEKEGSNIKINVMKIGFQKVLGSGRLTKPLIIEAKAFSKSAIKKIEDAGGKAVVV